MLLGNRVHVRAQAKPLACLRVWLLHYRFRIDRGAVHERRDDDNR
ncbi:MAG: hypothetical protein RLZZ303_494 [Candidatus Hydrogenedentota bacterium]